MGEGRRGLEEDSITKLRRWWGFRPWKRHSTILMVVGILFVFIGVQYVIARKSEGREIALAVVLQIAPIQVWGCVFIVSGLLTMLSAKWPPMTETWGYTVVTGLSSGWAATYLTGIIFYKSPAINLTQVFLWGVLAFMWWAISGLVNPERPVDDGHR